MIVSAPGSSRTKATYIVDRLGIYDISQRPFMAALAALAGLGNLGSATAAEVLAYTEAVAAALRAKGYTAGNITADVETNRLVTPNYAVYVSYPGIPYTNRYVFTRELPRYGPSSIANSIDTNLKTEWESDFIRLGVLEAIQTVTPAAPAPAPAPAPVYTAPAPAPVYTAPAPAPVYTAPVYTTQPAPAPAPAPTSNSGASNAASLPASMSFTNATSGNTVYLRVGDLWQIVATGPAGAPVYYIGGRNGASEKITVGAIGPDGYFRLSGSPGSGDVGTWRQTWYVGPVAVRSQSFQVLAAATSTPATSSSPATDTATSESIAVTGGGGGASSTATSEPTPDAEAEPLLSDLWARVQNLPAWVWIAAAAGGALLLKGNHRR